jgi:hypothetical protein
VNKKGHTQTLIAAHPGNRNAAKSGVFSPAALAPRIHELESAIAERPPEEAVTDIVRRELAALAALAEAMDHDLASGGIRARSGQPRTLVSLRLRLNEKMRRTAQEYARLPGCAHGSLEESPELSEDELPAPEPQVVLAEAIAAGHFCRSIAQIRPGELDPEAYLAAFIRTKDPAVSTSLRLRARRMLTKRSKDSPITCLCFSTFRARDELEFREWIDDIRHLGAKPANNDGEVAALVRRAAAGERLEPWRRHRQTKEAIEDVLAAEADRARGNAVRENEPLTGEHDPSIVPFWQIVLSPLRKVGAKERLDAFAALDQLELLPRCTCKARPEHELVEHKTDAWRAYTIRLVASARRLPRRLVSADLPRTPRCHRRGDR